MEVKTSKKSAIINAASSMFQQKGYHETKMNEIAQKAGIGKGTVYEYFSSKQELFEEVCIIKLNELYLSIEEIANKKISFKSKVIEIFKHKFKNMNVQKGLAESFFAQGDLISVRIKKAFFENMYKTYMKIIYIIQEGIDERIIKEDINIEMMASYIIGVSNQYLGMKLFYLDVKEEDINFEKMLDSLLEGFGN